MWRKYSIQVSETLNLSCWTPDLKILTPLAGWCMCSKKLSFPDSRWDDGLAEQGLICPRCISVLNPRVTKTKDLQVRLLKYWSFLVWNLNQGQVLRDYRPHPAPSTTIPRYGKMSSPNFQNISYRQMAGSIRLWIILASPLRPSSSRSISTMTNGLYHVSCWIKRS